LKVRLAAQATDPDLAAPGKPPDSAEVLMTFPDVGHQAPGFVGKHQEIITFFGLPLRVILRAGEVYQSET
jgi:hypothetical protein